MGVCKVCKGTGLHPYLTPTNEEEKRRMLFTDEECKSCGGRGRKSKADQPYDVQVFLNNQKLVKIAVLGENAADALVRAAEMFDETYAAAPKAGDVIHLEVLER